MSNRLFAAIDVGSFESTMKIFEFSGKGKIKEVDCVTKRIALGADTYASGKIGNRKMEELCECLKEFSDIMKAYRVTEYKAYGTSAIRETKNSAIVLDKIAQRTGIKLSILSNSEQRFLDYKSVATSESFTSIIVESTAIVDIGGGSIQISLFDKDKLVSTQNLRLGVLRIQERLNHLNAGRGQMEDLIAEMVGAQLSPYNKLFLGDREIKNIIIVDDYISPWAIKQSVNGQMETRITKDQFKSLKEQIHDHSDFQIAQSMDIPEDKVPLLQISCVLTDLIADAMKADTIWVPGVTLCDGIAYEYAENNKLIATEHNFEKDIIACAMNISKRYMGSKKRAETLSAISETIFDSTKKIHGLGKREKLFLKIAAILHDCGKYISLTNIGERSYDIVMATEIIGLSHSEREIVANVVRFNHSEFIYDGVIYESGLDQKTLLMIAKLTAILRLANALDRSHKQKMLTIKASLQENQLVLTADTGENIMLEQAYFTESAEFFEEVYSVRPVLKQRKK